MDELGGKIITGIIIAVLIFILQSAGVHKLIAGIFGGVSSPLVENVLTNNDKEEKIYWTSIDKCGTKKCYQLYLDKFPQGKFTSIANMYIKDKKITPTVQSKAKELLPTMPESKQIGGYIIHNNETVTKNGSLLMWKKCSEGQSGTNCSGKATKYTLDEAIELVKQANFAGYDDWKLPHPMYMDGLIYCSNGSKRGKNNHFSCVSEKGKNYQKPTIKQEVFPNTPSDYYWTLGMPLDLPEGVFTTAQNFRNGGAKMMKSTSYARVRLVRNIR